MTQSAVLFLTHFTNSETIERYRRLQRDLALRHRVFYCQDLLSSVAHRRITGDLVGPDLFLFDTRLIRCLPYERASEPWEYPTVVPGRVDLVVQFFHRLHPHFDRVYLVEHDVVWGGDRPADWRAIFDPLDESPADLLATNLARRDEHPRWNLWAELETPGTELPEQRQVRALMAFCRYSRAALLALEAAYAAGWSGHFEALVPTVCLATGLSVEDIGGEGPFVPPGCERRFYSSERIVLQDQPAKGTFVYRPEQHPHGQEPRLWHPVKINPHFDLRHRLRRWRHGHLDRARFFAEDLRYRDLERALAPRKITQPLLHGESEAGEQG